MHLSDVQIQEFQAQLLDYFDRYGRHDLPWRLTSSGIFDPYKIVVSELMLQQTQVPRVLTKYTAFLEQFPTAGVLATASLGDVLVAWQGLGYNRRAKFLWQAARQVKANYGGTFPATLGELVALPGIGPNTAGAILAYAYNQPAIFIETNIRTVYIHHFFEDSGPVGDKEIRGLLEQTLLRERPREFYWALMDYGTHLKKTHGNAAARSKHYVRQSPFEGSRRQVRGAILRTLASGAQPLSVLTQAVPDDRLIAVLQDLQQEGLVARSDSLYRLA